MTVTHSTILSSIPSWARAGVSAATSACSKGDVCGRGRDEHVAEDIRDRFLEAQSDAALDEVPGKDLALGQPGRVQLGQTTTLFRQDEGSFEFARFGGPADTTSDIRYGNLAQDGSFTYVPMWHNKPDGRVAYEGFEAGPGVFPGPASSVWRGNGIILP